MNRQPSSSPGSIAAAVYSADIRAACQQSKTDQQMALRNR